MGLFDRFKKKPAAPENLNHIVNPERETAVPLEVVQEGSHGDHWAALFGFDKLYKDQQIVRDILGVLMLNGNIKELPGGYASQVLELDNLQLKGLLLNNGMISAFPMLNTNKTLPVKTKVIKEWGHSGGAEAQIEAKGKNTFGLSFFATDYLENKTRYQGEYELNVKLTGFAYSAEPPPQMENMADDFVGYMPNAEYGRFSVLDYVGLILELTEVNDTEHGINGYLAALRLIQMDDDKDFFVVHTFINKDNIGVANISVGDRISGLMWLQGQIAG